MMSVEALPNINSLSQITQTAPAVLNGVQYWIVSQSSGVKLAYVHLAPDQAFDIHSMASEYKDAFVHVRTGHGELVMDGYSRAIKHDDIIDVFGGVFAEIINPSKYPLGILLFVFIN